MNFYHPLTILKASPEERTGRIKIFMRASSDREDSVGEVILKSAFADMDMRSEFIKSGYFDWNHLTDIIDIKTRNADPKDFTDLQIAKARAIIGKPENVGFKNDFPSNLVMNQEDGLYCSGYLIPENEFSIEIRKGLEAGIPYGASVSGFTRREDKVGSTIKKIQLRKIAIQPLQESINKDTTVSLMKSAFPSLTTLMNNVRKGYDFEDDYDDYGLNKDETLANHDESKEEQRFIELESKVDFILKYLQNQNPSIVSDRIAEILMEEEDSDILKPKLLKINNFLCRMGIGTRDKNQLLEGIRFLVNDYGKNKG